MARIVEGLLADRGDDGLVRNPVERTNKLGLRSRFAAPDVTVHYDGE